MPRGLTLSNHYLQQIVEATNQLHPDRVVITGDLVDAHLAITPETLTPLSKLSVRLLEEDGKAVVAILQKQLQKLVPDEIANEAQSKHQGFKITTSQGETMAVQIPLPELESEPGIEPAPAASTTIREAPTFGTSHKMQALLVEIGVATGFQVWIPKADKDVVSSEMTNLELLVALPYTQFSEPALKTVEQIDVLWLQKKTIVRAFEVEYTTAVYSGIAPYAV